MCVDTGDILCTAKRFSHPCHAWESGLHNLPSARVCVWGGRGDRWLLEKRGKRKIGRKQKGKWEMHLGSSTYAAKVKTKLHKSPIKERSTFTNTLLFHKDTSFYPFTHDPTKRVYVHISVLSLGFLRESKPMDGFWPQLQWTYNPDASLTIR